MKMDRRTFLKTTAATAMAVSLTGLLGGCGGSGSKDLYADSVGLNQTVELQGIQLTVKELGTLYDSAAGCFYIVPRIQVKNSGALPISVDPLGGSFRILMPDNKELTLNADTMNRISNSTSLTPLKAQTLTRGVSASGCLCASGSGVSRISSLRIIYYPAANDTTIYLRSTIKSEQFTQLLGF